jgi:ribosomal protein S18 acetylase RimI-like enzyme
MARLHVQSWHETYTGILPDEVLSTLSVSHRAQRWEESLRNPAKFNDTVVYLYEANNVLFGFGACSAQRDADLKAQGFDGELEAIYVLQQFQRNGAGMALMRKIANDLSARGFRGMSLWVLRDNQPARRFYEKAGGETVRERENIRGKAVLTELAYGWRDLATLSARNATTSLR